MKYFFATMICLYSFINFASNSTNLREDGNQQPNLRARNQQNTRIKSSQRSQTNLLQALAIQSKSRNQVSGQKRSGKGNRNNNPR